MRVHNAICAAQLARYYGVHRSAITRELAEFTLHLEEENETIRLGREYHIDALMLVEFHRFYKLETINMDQAKEIIEAAQKIPSPKRKDSKNS